MTSPTLVLLESSQLIKQGAEAKVYKGILHQSLSESREEPEWVLFKHRFHKKYRHPTIDATLTKSRVTGEARALLKCLKSGVRVPGIRMVDAAEGVLGLEWINGESVRVLLGGGDEGDDVNESDDDDGPEEDYDRLKEEFGLSPEEVMLLIGEEIAKMHKADIIHGDLTTSNMMLQQVPSDENDLPEVELVLIDFGLSFSSSMAEDKAVDLYVLERAFASTHPDSEPLFALVLKAYADRLGPASKPINKKLDEVRLRGRKRSLVG